MKPAGVDARHLACGGVRAGRRGPGRRSILEVISGGSPRGAGGMFPNGARPRWFDPTRAEARED